MKSLNTIPNIVITNDIISKLTQVYRFQGKDFFYKEKLKNDLETVVEQTIEKDVYFLSLLTNIDVSDNKIKLILKNKFEPKNESEEIIKQYFDMFKIIHKKTESFELIANEISSLHKKLYPISKSDQVTFSRSTRSDVDKKICDKTNISKRQVFEELLDQYQLVLKRKDNELILTLCSFYIDFLNIKPYTRNNEILSLLTFYILTLKFDFNIFKFVSFFELIYLAKNDWEEVVAESSFNWAQGYPQIISIYRYVLDFILEAYDKVEEMVDHYEFDSKLNKSDNIENTILKLTNIFSKDDIRNQHPYVSESTINRTLQRLRDEEKIRPLGTGRSAKWIKLHSIIEQQPFTI